MASPETTDAVAVSTNATTVADGTNVPRLVWQAVLVACMFLVGVFSGTSSYTCTL